VTAILSAQMAAESLEAPPVCLAGDIAPEDALRYGVVESGGVRLDRWLWAARLFKTRSQAAKACSAGHVKQAGEALKASRLVRVGDRLEVATEARARTVVVRRLSERRGPATIARALFDDHSPPPPPPEDRVAVRDRGTGRPEKRDRRLLIRLRGR
jgi:ribosome-associated heat shock protein Hsp15